MNKYIRKIYKFLEYFMKKKKKTYKRKIESIKKI